MLRPFLMAIRLSAALAVLVPGANAQTSPDRPPYRDFFVSIERGACFGTCPVYSISVSIDGSLRYVGIRFVKVKGIRITKIPAGDIERIRDAFARAGYSNLRDNYSHEDRTDHPTVVTSYQWGGKYKRVLHYHGDESAPPALSALENELDQILRTDQWIGTEKERSALRE